MVVKAIKKVEWDELIPAVELLSYVIVSFERTQSSFDAKHSTAINYNASEASEIARSQTQSFFTCQSAQENH